MFDTLNNSALTILLFFKGNINVQNKS